jgi:thiosulfate/3-mercaptopyruvate sulfurtransferase
VKQLKKKILFSLLALALVALPLFSVSCNTSHFTPSRTIDPIVSTDWLESNLSTSNLVVLDIRTPDEYTAGHITGAINSPETNWYVFFAPNGLLMELPAVEDLFATIGDAGITKDSKVVVVCRTSDSAVGTAVYAIAGATRVAITLIYAGVENVAVLDGGYDKWVADGKTVSTAPITPTPVTYTGEVNTAMFVSKDYVTKKISKAIILDGRDPQFYFGVDKEPFYDRSGHIPGATCLPAPYFWTFTDGIGTYKDTATLEEMAAGAVGDCSTSREIIVYCGVGGYASTLWFVLHEVAGCENIEVFDGAAEEWTADPTAPVVLYKWE